MSLNHKPATPLPWMTEVDIGVVDIVGPEEQHVLLGGRAALDSEYAVHAANAYPKLVGILRHVLREEPDWNSVRSLLETLGEKP